MSIPAAGFAEPTDCFRHVLNYGDRFEIETIPAPVVAEQWVTETPDTAAVPIHWTRFRWTQGSATIRECSSCSPRKAIVGLVLSAPQDLPCALEIGMVANDVIKRMGEPDERSDDALEYRGDPADDRITFFIGAGKLMAIQWDFYDN